MSLLSSAPLNGDIVLGTDSRITGAEQTSHKGAVNGYPSLDGGGHIPSGQLPVTPTAFTRGTANLTFAGGAFSSVTTVAHGLGITPASVQLSNWFGGPPGSQPMILYHNQAADATNIYVVGWLPTTTGSGTASFYWVCFR